MNYATLLLRNYGLCRTLTLYCRLAYRTFGEYALTKKRSLFVGIVLIALAGVLSGCSSSDSRQAELSSITELTVYSGRSESFIAPFFADFQAETGITLNIRYGDSSELAAQILEEGENSPADLFIAQDAGSLGAVSAAELFTPLDSSVGSEIAQEYVAADRHWIGITGRARVFAYNPSSLKTLPTSVVDLSKALYRSQVGIAPSNASFQAFVTAMINEKGEEFTKNWLLALKANDVKIYPKNSAIVEAIDRNEISLGLVNHYYIWEVSQGLGRDINVQNGFFKSGDLGNLINVSGAGIFASSKKQAGAAELINFLTSQKEQRKFVSQTHEYSLIKGMASPENLPALKAIGSPAVDLDALANLARTQDLLIEVGLL